MLRANSWAGKASLMAIETAVEILRQGFALQ